MKTVLLAILLVACGGAAKTPPSNTATATTNQDKRADTTCKTDADCGEGMRCNECPTTPPADPDVDIYGGLCPAPACVAK